MVGGAAYYAGRRGAQASQREADQEARLEELEAQQYQQQPQYAPPPAAAPAAPGAVSDDTVEQLQKLAGLRDQGILTEEEFDAQKKKLLGM
jgi:hypothetical protein